MSELRELENLVVRRSRKKCMESELASECGVSLLVSDDRSFSEPDDMTDIIFIVEDKELYFNTVVLSICSPVFKAMFTSDFKEKEAKKIHLPGKNYEDMVAFFKQIHPLHCKRTPITDASLQKIIPLADEYQATSVLDACEDFIGVKLSGKTCPTDLTLLLLLCERHHLKRYRKELFECCVQQDSSTLEDTKHYQELSLELQKNILDQRCKVLELFLNAKVKPLAETLQAAVNKEAPCLSCTSWQRSMEYACQKCILSKLPLYMKMLEPFPQ